MGHKNKNKRSLQGRGLCGRIKALLLAGLLVLPIVGNLMVKLDVWADSPTKSVCKTAVLTPSNDGGTTYGIQVCADEYADGTISVTKMTGLADYLDGSGTPVSEITIGKVAIKTKRDFETGNKYQNAWVDFGANGRGTSGSPDDHADDGKNGTSNSSPISNGHVFEASAYKGQGAEAYVNRVLEHVNYWANQWKQDLKIEGGIQGGTKVKEANCVVGAAVNDCSDNVLDYLTDQDKLRIDDISTCYIAEVSRMTSGAGTTIYREIRCDGTNVADVTYSAKTVTESNQTAEQASGNADDPASSGSGGTGSSIAGGGTTSATGGGSGSESAAETKPDCWKNTGALSWIVCTAIDALGSMIEWAYTTFIEPMMKINSSMFDQDGQGKATYQAWGTFQGLANIIFVILMLVVIISQVTGVGISNLGIKRTLPRIIVAVLLINLSYFICSLAVDVSNIIGVSINELFRGLATDPGTITVAPEISGTSLSFGDELIAGGTVAAAIGGAALSITALGGTGAVITVLLSLISAIVSIVVFFLLLSARQAAVILLVVISPIALVLYMLPNTQKYFNQYTKLFSTILMLYPIAGAIMGAGEFASRLYLAVSDTTIFNICVAMLIDVLPFMAIPKLTSKAMDGIAGIGSIATGFGRRAGRNLSGAVRNSEGVQRALENSRLGLKNNGELSATGRMRQAWGKSKLPGSKTNQRRTLKALQAADQRAKEDRLGENVAAMGNDPFRAARERGVTMGDADTHGIERRGDSEFIKAQGMQQKDRVDAEVAGLVANYARDVRNDGDQDLQRAAVNAAVVQGVTRAHDEAKMADDTYAQMNILRNTDRNEEKYTGLIDEYGADTRAGGNVDNRQASINRAKIGAAGRVANAKRIADPLAFQAAIANITSKEDRDAVDALESDLANRSTELENMTDAEQIDFFQKYIEKHGEQGMQAVAQFANDNNRGNVLQAVKRTMSQYELGRDENGNMTLAESGQALMRRFYQGAQGNGALMKLAEVKNFAENSVFAGKAGASASISDFAVDAQYEDASGNIHATAAAREFAQRLSAADIDGMSGGEIEGLIRSIKNGGFAGDTKKLSDDLQRYLGTDNGKKSGKFELLSKLQGEAQVATERRDIEVKMARGEDFQVRLTSGGTYNVGSSVYNDLDDLAALSRNTGVVASDRAMLASIAGRRILDNPSSLNSVSGAAKQSVINTVAPTIAGATSQQFSQVAGDADVVGAIQGNAEAVKNLTPANRSVLVTEIATKASDGTPDGARLIAGITSGMSSSDNDVRGLNTEIASKMLVENGATMTTSARIALAGGVGSNFAGMSTGAQRELVSVASSTSSASDEGRSAARSVVDKVVTSGALASAAPEVREQVTQQKVADLSNVSGDDFVTLARQQGLSEATTKELAANASVEQIQTLADKWLEQDASGNYTAEITAQDKSMAQALVQSGYLPDTDVSVGGIGDNRIDRIIEVSGAETAEARTEAEQAMGATRLRIRNEQSGATELVRRFDEINNANGLSDEERSQAKTQVALETGSEAVVGAMKDSGLSGYITEDVAREVAAASPQNAEMIARTAIQSGNVAVSKELAVDPRVQQMLSGSEALRHGLDERSAEKMTDLEQERGKKYDERYRSASESYSQARQRSGEIASSVPGASGNYSGVYGFRGIGPRGGSYGAPPGPPPVPPSAS